MTDAPPPTGQPSTNQPLAADGVPIIQPPAMLPPKAAWHQRRAPIAIIAALIGLGLGLSTARDENATADKARTDAKRDAKEIRADARKESSELLGGIDERKADLEEQVEALTRAKQALEPDVRALRKELGKLTREKATSTFEGTGQYIIGADVRPGTYKAAASIGCYYEILKKGDGSYGDILDNENMDGPAVLTIPSSGARIVSVQDCGTFKRFG